MTTTFKSTGRFLTTPRTLTSSRSETFSHRTLLNVNAYIYSKYIQTHFFDTAFGERPGSVSGTGNHAWTGRDDMTELYFRDWDHLKA